MIGELFPYDPAFTGGAYIASGDVNGDGFDDIIVGADAGGGPDVKAISGRDGAFIEGFFAYDMRFTGGVRVAAGDVNGDGKADIICGRGAGGGPNVTVFNGASGTILSSFFAYTPSFTSGLYVAAGDLNGDGKAEIVVGAGELAPSPVPQTTGGVGPTSVGPNVSAFDLAGNRLMSFFAYDPGFTAGVRVAATDRDGDGLDDIITVPGAGGGPDVHIYNGVSGAQIDQFFAVDPLFTGGLYVAASQRT